MTTFQVTSGDFVDALGDALLAAGNDLTLPMLCAVHLEGTKGDQFVTFTATDRFILAQRRIPTVDPLTDSFAALIPAEQVKLLIGVHKTGRARRGVPAVPVEIRLSEAYLTAGSISVPLDMDHEFVKYASLFPKVADGQIDVLPVDLALLARVAKMSVYSKGRGVRLRWTTGKTNEAGYGTPPRIVLVDFPEVDPLDARVIFMPMRMPG